MIVHKYMWRDLELTENKIEWIFTYIFCRKILFKAILRVRDLERSH